MDMLSAIKNRRGGLLNDTEENAHQMPEERGPKGQGVDMKSLVQALSPDQKAQLLSILVSGEKGSAKPAESAPQIEEGEMGPGEESEIQEELGEGHESEDEIAQSMISSSDKMRSDRGDRPRNLGERMKFDLAKKLKNREI